MIFLLNSANKFCKTDYLLVISLLFLLCCLLNLLFIASFAQAEADCTKAINLDKKVCQSLHYDTDASLDLHFKLASAIIFVNLACYYSSFIRVLTSLVTVK